MGPRSAARSAAVNVRGWTPAQWIDAGAWAGLAFGVSTLQPDSVPAMLIMFAAAATYRLLPAVAFAGVIAVGAVVAGPTGDLEPTFALVVAPACYLHRRKVEGWRWVLAPAGVAVAVVVSEAAIAGDWDRRAFTRTHTPLNAEMNPGLFIVAACLGLALGLVGNALDRTRALEGETETLRTRTEASEEHGRWLEMRTDLARELHDLVGHHVTAMVVQAEAGLVGDPRRALHEVGDSGRRALSELDSLVHYLRDPSNDGPITTVQRLANIEALFVPLERKGIVVDSNIDSDLTLESSVELAAYRIVQEALTNVARHARAQHAWVSVDGAGEHVHVRVSDDGVGPPDDDRRGSGLGGIAERVASHHGIWTIGARHGGGTTVDAYLVKEAT